VIACRPCPRLTVSRSYDPCSLAFRPRTCCCYALLLHSLPLEEETRRATVAEIADRTALDILDSRLAQGLKAVLPYVTRGHFLFTCSDKNVECIV